MSRGIDQLSQETRSLVRWLASSTSSPGPIALGTDGPRGRSDLLGDSCSGPMALGVDHLSWATRTPFRGTLVSTSYPRRIALGSEGPRR